ncbi:MAG: alpha/beta hydrolase-fold protein [Planctomycetota bacterium]
MIALALCGSGAPAQAGLIDSIEFSVIRHRIRGQILDYTNNHGRDRRIYSPSLAQCRDAYVYLPPCYNANLKYPVIFVLHGFAQDERSFFYCVTEIDRAINAGRLPPAVVVAVDGSIDGRAGFWRSDNSSFYINSKAGNFEDYLMVDVWNWVHQNFSIRPEREAHVLAGFSMGGGASFDLGMRHRDRVGVVAAIYPPVNLRYVDCHNNFMANFDRCCWGWRTQVNDRREVVGIYFGGLYKVRMSSLVEPLFDWGQPALQGFSEHNPAEHLANLRNGDLAMYIAYGKKDQFNLDAQVESFVEIARARGIDVTVRCDPHGRHDARTALYFLPGVLDWIGCKLQGYGPTP